MSGVSASLKVAARKIDSISPYPDNPRNNQAAIQHVADSIAKYGWRQPIVVDKQGVIIAGHTRYFAALHLQLDKVPVHVADMSEEDARAYRLADNKTGEIATWDDDKLLHELMQLTTDNPEIEIPGWSEQELAELLGGDRFEGETDPDDAPDPKPEKYEPITKPGDLWMMGPHRLVCGDATDRAAWLRLMHEQDEGALLLTDPPYGVEYEGGTGLTIQGDDITGEALREFYGAALGHAFDCMLPGAAFYLFHADSEGYNVRGAVQDCGVELRQTLIWAKDRLVLGRQDYHWQHEPIFYGWKRSHDPVLYGWKDGAAHQWLSDRTQTTLLHFDRPSKSEKHPTMKPVEMLNYLIENSTRPGQIVLDPFLGSGSTLIAATTTHRVCFGIELDPKYCDVIIERWEDFTGDKATRAEA